MQDSQSQLLHMVRAYKTPQAAEDLLAAHPPLVITGTTAAGKDALAQHIQMVSDWRHVVTTTTRPIREGEVNGKDYWFVSEAEMTQLIKDQAFIEVKWIHSSQVSGPTMKAYSDVVQAGGKPLLRIDVQGIEGLLAAGVSVRPYFILPPSFEVLMERLEKRGRMSHTEKIRRLESAERELDIAIRNDKFILVVNDQIKRVSDEILQGFTDGASQRAHRELAKKIIDHIQAY